MGGIDDRDRSPQHRGRREAPCLCRRDCAISKRGAMCDDEQNEKAAQVAERHVDLVPRFTVDCAHPYPHSWPSRISYGVIKSMTEQQIDHHAKLATRMFLKAVAPTPKK